MNCCDQSNLNHRSEPTPQNRAATVGYCKQIVMIAQNYPKACGSSFEQSNHRGAQMKKIDQREVQ